MINEDKAKQIARNIAYNLGNKVCDDIKTYGYEDVYNAALQALQWEDEQHTKEKQQWIKKVTDFISQHFYTSTSNHVISKKDYYSLTELVRDINQAMEE